MLGNIRAPNVNLLNIIYQEKKRPTVFTKKKD